MSSKYDAMPTTNYHPPSASGKTYARIPSQQQPKGDYHLSALLNKENKALQNLLAAVELNRTTALESTAKQPTINAVISRATASAKQQMHMMHMQQQQQQ